MFNWTSTYIVNSNLDSSGKAKWSAQTEDTANGILGSFYFKRGMNFVKPNVVSIFKRASSDPVLAKAKFTMSNDGVGLYRLGLYIRLSGSQNSYYSNDFVFKGKPLYFEYEIKDAGETAAELAARVVRLIKKIQVMYDNKYVDVSANGSDLTVTGTTEYQLFTKAEIEKFNPNAGLNGGEFEVTKAALDKGHEDYDGVNEITKSKEGFGTYTHLLKDLRLPTMEAIRFGGINQEELPVPGAKYHQYIVTYCVERGIMGGDAIGDTVKSRTSHVFFVKADIAADFEAALANAGKVEAVTK